MRFTQTFVALSFLLTESFFPLCRADSVASIANIALKMADEANPPIWPDSVSILRDTDDVEHIRKVVEATQDPWDSEKDTFTCDKHFSSERRALLFAPGTYRGIDVEVGYYVQLAGLGSSPDDVKFVDYEHGPYVPALNKHLHKGGTSLDTFWRSAENFYLERDMKWSVSQAAPLRRVHVAGDLHLHDKAAYASGGHLANSKIDGKLRAGGQQQYLVRNVELGKGATGGAWSMVYAGCSGQVPRAAAGNATAPAITVTPQPKVRMEKPYIAMKDDGTKFELRVPRPLRGPDTVGPLLYGQHEDIRDFSKVRVVRESGNPFQDIQSALDEGKDIVLTPGIFSLEQTLVIRHPDQVILGLGLATLVAPSNGSPCIRVDPQVPGVRIAGVMLEASVRDSSPAQGPSSLLEWGSEGVSDPGLEHRPGGLFDVFCRVGGAISGNRTSIFVDYMVRIHSGNIIGDNLWLWRADHGALAPNEKANYPHISPIFWQTEKHEFRVETGAEFNGNDINLFGLAVEHANGHQTLWNGENGSVHFYQCEFPYGVGQEFKDAEFRGYMIGETVKEHEVHAPGIYSNFRNDDVFVSTAIEHPESPSVLCHNPFTVKLDNQGGIDTIVNGKGGRASEKGMPVRMNVGTNDHQHHHPTKASTKF